LTCAWKASTEFFGSHYITINENPQSTHKDKVTSKNSGTAAIDQAAPANASNVTPVTPEKGTTAEPKSKAKKVAFTQDS
jgi:ribosomal protein L24